MSKSSKGKKQEQLRQNRTRGKMAEQWVEATAPLLGRIAKRTGHGSDFELKRVGPAIKDPITGKVEPETIIAEVKSGKGKLSPLQQETQKKNKDNYKVVR